MRHCSESLLRTTALIGCLASMPSTHMAQAQTMEDLGTLGGTSTTAFLISADGSTIVGAGTLIVRGAYRSFKVQNGSLQDLGDLGRSSVLPYDVSADGSVIVGVAYNVNNRPAAFRYSNGVMQDLGTLGGEGAFAYAVSADGSVIVGETSTGSALRAFKYTGSTMTDLGSLGVRSAAVAVSANGSVIAGYNEFEDETTRAFKYQDNRMTDLGALGGVYDTSFAYAVSADGSVIVGGSGSSANRSIARAFKYSNTAMVDLGTLGGNVTVAYDVSADGSTVVGMGTLAGSTIYRVFKHDGSQIIDLGTLGGTLSYIDFSGAELNIRYGYKSISANGSVIVGLSAITGDVGYHAFRYENGVMQDLGTLGGANSYATSVSADGSIVVGSSQVAESPVSHAFAWRMGKMIDLPETYADLMRSANNVRNTMALRTSSMALMMEYDCRVFSSHNMCVSFGGRYSELSSSSNEGAGMLTIAYRITPSLRVGAFIDQRMTQAKPAGINFKDDTPSVGAFVGYDHNGDGTGPQAKVTGVYNTGKVSVTRLASSGNTEAGGGRSALKSYAIGAELGWGFRVHEDWVATPYAGIRHTKSELGGYAEGLTDAVKFPIAYAAYGQRLTTMTGGLRLDGRLTDRVSIALSAGVEHDISSKMDAYAGLSNIPGLASFSFATSAKSNRTRAVGSAALSYHIDKSQSISAGVYVRENAYVSQATKTVMMKYQVAF
jgi:probable HAF family extracellular repeat protein